MKLGCIDNSTKNDLMNQLISDGCVCRTAMATQSLLIINRPGVAGAVLQTPPSFIH